MPPGSAFPAFGMAEVAIAGTFPPPGRGLVVDTVDRRVLETERYAAPVDAGSDGARSFARLGRAVPGLEIRIVGPDDGRELREREVGELQIRGTSRSEEHTSELQSLMRISYTVFCLKKKKQIQ